jgi:Stress responsive A/B Barrel Domain.
MIRHIVAWSFKEEFSPAENAAHAARIKAELEALPEIIGGICELNVHIELLGASNRNAVLNSLFESEEALAAYQTHPEHKKVSAFVRSVMTDRVCLDYAE